ncbi:MAG: cytochrome c [Pseudomonadota bacterium]
MLKPLFSSIVLNLVGLAACAPDPANPEQAGLGAPGEVLAKQQCSDCHAIGASDLSPHPEAPPFRTLGEAYPVEYLAEALAEGIIVGHPDMPVFELSPDQIRALLSHLEEVQVSGAATD